MSIEKGKVVVMHYVLKNDGGEVIDSSEGKDPLSFLHGQGQIIVGLEKALEGKSKGDKIEVTVAPEEGYGIQNDALINQVPITQFEDQSVVKVGAQFQVQTPEGVRIATVKSVEAEQVTVDFNHPLAGESLHFSVDIVDVKDQPEEATECCDDGSCSN